MKTTSSTARANSLSHKLALAAGGGAAAALAGMPTASDAAIVAASNTPIAPAPTAGPPSFWDVDGNGGAEFLLLNYYSDVAFFEDIGVGARLVVPAASSQDGIAKLSLGVAIGTSLDSAFKFHAAPQNFNAITAYGAIAFRAAAGGWTFGGANGTGYFGFKFTISGNTHYGWGEMTIANQGNMGNGDNFVINQAWYNDTPNAPVQAGVIPEPSSAALLALGAAGLAAWRRRR